MEETQPTIKRRRSWFSRSDTLECKPDSKIEVISSSNSLFTNTKPDKKRDSIVDQSLDNNFIIDKSLIQKDLDNLVSNIRKRSSNRENKNENNGSNNHLKLKRKSSLLGHLLNLTKNNETLEDDNSINEDNNYNDSTNEPNIASANSNDQCSVTTTKSRSQKNKANSGRPRSQGSLGQSVTPFKIRDNLNHLFGFEPIENPTESAQGSSEESEDASKLSRTQSRPLSRGSRTLKSFINNYPGIPCTRLALLDHNQNLAFVYQLNNIRKKTNDYNYYFKWSIWLIKLNEHKKQSTIDRLIENNLDFKIFLKQIKNLVEVNKYYKIHIFKFGLIPNKNSKDLINGETLEFRVPFTHQFEFLKEMSKIILNDEIYRPETIQLPVCGISFKKLKLYSIISVWIQPPIINVDKEKTFSLNDILDLVEFLKDSLSDHLQYIIDSVVLMNNKNLSTTKVFEVKS